MDWISFVSVVVSTIFSICCVAECGPLNEYIRDYQPLVYDRDTVHTNHERVRRSADNHLYIRFSAFNKHFHLKLSSSQGAFSPDHQVYTQGQGLRHVPTPFLYEGQVKGEPKSLVQVSVHNGSLEGHIQMPDTTYHIEPAAKYISNPGFHTIIYPETHLETDPFRDQRSAGSCGMDHQHINDFLQKASSLQEPSPDPPRKYMSEESEGVPHNIYSEFSNRQKRSTGKAPHSRQKRELKDATTCPLHMRADPMLFAYFQTKKHGRVVPADQAEEEILAFFSNHVNAISAIYRDTVFKTYQNTMENVGLNFVIHRSTVMHNCSDSQNPVSRSYCSNTLDVSNYLELTSEADHSEYCLVFTFTYRDFSGGTLGLAWVATEDNVESGVCGSYRRYSNGKMKTLNTGIVTIINFGKTVPNRVSQLTFAHEAGHNFGSPHDIGSEECAPFGTSRSDAKNGNYIMFPSATSGDRINNAHFSLCSRDNMTRIIQQVVNGKRRMCFTKSGQAFCGNKITEEGEQCDCGFGSCSEGTCCVGRVEGTNGGCTLIPGKQCSPDSGPCCDSGCIFRPFAANFTCEDMSDCKERSACNGSSHQCPESDHKPNGTFCSSNSKVCMNGECIAPVCAKIEWEECFLTTESNALDKELCFVACKNPATGECISSTNSDALGKNVNQKFKVLLTEASAGASGLAVKLPAGSACDNFRGYCDTFNYCQRIDSQGPFNQLTNMIFNPVTFNLVKDWIVEHWWAVLLMSVGLVVFMGVFIKVFSYSTPSQDPKKKRRQRQQQQQPPRGQPPRGQPPRGQPSKQQGRGSPSAPPPYNTGLEMDMRGSNYQGYHQYDRLAPGYSKNHI